MYFSFTRTLTLYLLLVGAVRMLGKRQLGQLEPAEFVVTMLIANLASGPMEDPGIPMLRGIVPILTVLGAELVLSFLTLRSLRLRRLLCGKPVILIENGRILRENLRSARITLDELTGSLREKEVLDLSTVQYAILETTGELSVFPYPRDRPPTARECRITPEPQSLPVTLVEDGRLLDQNLSAAGRDRAWVEQTLREHGETLSTTLLLTVDGRGKLLLLPREEKP